MGYRESVPTRSSLTFAAPRTVTAEDVEAVLARAVPRCEGRSLSAMVVQWMLDGEKIDEPVGAFGETLSADLEVLVER